ncbi:MAG: dipeptidase [Acidimicrobiales bacterium]|nr:dipeptidase [Acidimicrobiales bacterium]
MCDSLVALAPSTARGVTLFAKNSDRPPGEVQDIEWSPSRTEASTRVTHITVDGLDTPTVRAVISRPRWCWGAEHGVNEAGVAIGNHSIYTTLDPRPFPPALIGMDLVRLGLERAVTASNAVEVMTGLLERHGQGGTGHDVALIGKERPYWSSFLVADPVEAWMLETSGSNWEVARVDRVASMSNRTSIPAFDAAHRHPGQPVERLIDPRLRASRAVLADRPVTFEALAAHLRSHDSCVEPGWSVCMHVGTDEVTTASMIAEMPIDRPPTAWMLTGSPCENDYSAYAF